MRPGLVTDSITDNGEVDAGYVDFEGVSYKRVKTTAVIAGVSKGATPTPVFRTPKHAAYPNRARDI